MVTRNANLIGAAILFGLVVVAAIIWGSQLKSLQHHQASVEVQQMQERSWGVEVKEVPPDAGVPGGDEDKKTVVAEH